MRNDDVFDIKIVKTRDVETPRKATQYSACYDLFVPRDFKEAVVPGRSLLNDNKITFPLGIKVALPPNTVMLINSRSGMGFKHQVRLSNCQGVIDSDYRDELMIQLVNDSKDPITIHPNDRIGQFWIQPVWFVNIIEVDELDKTDRNGGFGSTGR